MSVNVSPGPPQALLRHYLHFVVVVTYKLSYKTGANIMQIGALFASRQPISSNPGAVLWARLGKINITPDATVIRITVQRALRIRGMDYLI